jgi:hypothetical protein
MLSSVLPSIIVVGIIILVIVLIVVLVATIEYRNGEKIDKKNDGLLFFKTVSKNKKKNNMYDLYVGKYEYDCNNNDKDLD